jgi:hypothetical protein
MILGLTFTLAFTGTSSHNVPPGRPGLTLRPSFYQVNMGQNVTSGGEYVHCALSKKDHGSVCRVP